METNNGPLVSVPVKTYNSAKTVLETLESIKAQTYQNIELIISDDCSTDDTVQLCKGWLEKNSNRFARTFLMESPINTGVTANCNRAEKACRGEWIKGIAGDDILFPECIESLIDYVTNNSGAYIVFGRVETFGPNEELCDSIKTGYDNNIDLMKSMSVEEQLELVYGGQVPPAPGCIYNRKKFAEAGIKNDERIRNIEDWPRWIIVLNHGIRFWFLDKYIVKYRVGSGVTFSSRWSSLDLYKSRRQTYLYYIFPQQYQNDPETTIENMLMEECSLYERYLDMDHFVGTVKSIKLYKFFRLIYMIFHNR